MTEPNRPRIARHLVTGAMKVVLGFDPSANLRKALRLLAAPDTTAELVEDADLDTLRRRVVRPLGGADGRPVCLFATYSRDGRIWPHVTQYCRDLRAAGCRLVLIVATDRLDLKVYDPGNAIADAMVVVDNFGYDFSAWARTLRLWPDLWEASALWFANDSVYHSPTALHAMMDKVARSTGDVVALTESTAFRRHFQSYFFMLRANALTNPAVRTFFTEIRALGDKQKVIETCEVPLPSLLTSAGLNLDILFPLGADDPRSDNPTLAAWSDLLKMGLPFVKVQLLRENPARADISTWRKDLAAAGFRMDEVEMHIGSLSPPASAMLLP